MQSTTVSKQPQFPSLHRYRPPTCLTQLRALKQLSLPFVKTNCQSNDKFRNNLCTSVHRMRIVSRRSRALIRCLPALLRREVVDPQRRKRCRDHHGCAELNRMVRSKQRGVAGVERSEPPVVNWGLRRSCLASRPQPPRILSCVRLLEVFQQCKTRTKSTVW